MTQELVIKQTPTMRKLTTGIGLIFSLLLLSAVNFKAFSQTNLSALKQVVVNNEKSFGKVDGSIELIFDAPLPAGKYKVAYDLHAVGNTFIVSDLQPINENKLVLNNVRSGAYYNLKVLAQNSNKTAQWNASFTVQPAKFDAGSGNTNNLTCSNSINYTDCNNNSRSTGSNTITGKAYNSTSSGTPCGYEISGSCTVINVKQWHCIDGDLSAPPSNNSHSITNYTGVGLTALQASRINWVVCNYPSITSSVSAAIWKICGTGGSANSIYNAAVAAVPSANGSENQMVFYKSGNSSYQDMVKWDCVTTQCTGRTNSLYFNKLDNGPDIQITNGSVFSVTQLGSLYNLEAGVSGTVGSVKFTVTGPTSSSNIENVVPYNSPGTGSGAWTGTAGNYSVNVKVYSLSNAGGTLCHDTTITFILTNSLTLGNRVWYDTNNDGLENNGENGVRGVTVKLYKNTGTGNTPEAASIATTITDADGYYSFTGLTAGNYIVGIVMPAGYMKSSVNGGDPDNNIDKDNNGINVVGNEVRGLAITLVAGAEPSGGGYENNTYDFGILPDCACTNSAANLLTNASFESGTTGWSWSSSNGSLTTGTGYVACGSKNGFNNQSSGTSKVWQDVNVAAGSTVTFSAYAGTHAPGIGCSPTLSLIFLNSSNAVIGQTNVTVTRVVGDYNDQLEQYSMTATAPAGTVKARVQSSITCNTMKLDAFCLTVTPPASNLALGNLVFYDFNRSGMYDAGDGLVSGAIVRLYNDANNDNIPDGPFIQATTTNAAGIYSFTGLTPGNYIVGVVVPTSYAITVINGGDPDNDIDNDNNAVTLVNGEARGMAITLTAGGEPTGGNTNNTYDFGFYNPIAPPNGGENCFGGTNPVVFAKSFWNANANSQTVTIRVTFAKTFVDNCYKSSGNADNWNRSHTFGNLTGSDHLQWSIRDANGAEKLAFKQDYISASSAFPSGYGTLGFGGDGGNPTVGSTTDVLSFRTSLSTNFNDFGYVLTTNSPATDTNYTPNPAAPNWIYDVWYEVTVKASVFGAAGFGFVNVASVHASPSKTGNNTETITNNPCSAGSIGDRVWIDANKNGVQDAGEVGLAGVVVSLYEGTTNKVLASTVTDGYGNYKFSNLETTVTGVTYQVGFSLVPGYSFSPNSGAVTVTNNSDANTTTGRTGTITLTNAVPNVTYVDAGLYYTASARLGDFVWNDLNKNGIQDAGEPGIAGVTVMLYTSANVLYRSTITSNNGYYFFNEVPAGSYYLKVTPPIGYQVSPKDAAADDIDSDIDPVTFKTANITVVAGTNNLTIDAGLHVTSTTGASASLGDRVWEDLNNDNIQNAGEPGIANVTVQLYNAANVLQATQTTDAFGNYIFNGLMPGTYYVKFTLPAGFSYVTANVGTNDDLDSDADAGTGNSHMVTLVADEINTTVDAGMRRTTAGAALGDYVWYDLNKNGIQDGGNEVGVPGITVLLYNSSNVVVATTTTNSAGFYMFTGLPASTTYTVGFENIPAGYGFSPNTGAITVANNSDVNPSTGRTGNVTTGTAGSTITYVDAGLMATPNTFDSKASVGDRVWNDLNNNGIQDAGEPGIAGVTVTLYAANGTTVIATTTSDALGMYLFTNLNPGSYVVGFSGLPAGYVFAPKDAGTDDSKDSDADITTGKTAPFNLASGEINLTIDAGARNTNSALSAIGNFVWFDLNNNGIQDTGEPGVAGVSVKLTNMTNIVVATTTTNAQGEYLFTDLPAGNYFVEFGNFPAGFTAGIKNASGSTAANNSDANTATGKTDIIVLPASTIDRDWDMGLVSTTRAAVGDFVWNDYNGNGIQDAAEPGVAGITVTLYDNSNAAVASTVTDANGFYLFPNLMPGTYSIGFATIPASSTFTLQNAAGSTAANNSDASPATGRTATFSLIAGQVKTDIDAGLITYKAAVGDYVWGDLNRNGIQDANEPAAPGVTVTLYKSTDAIIGNGDDVAVGSAVTDANGYYFMNEILVPQSGFAKFYMRFTDVPTSYVSFTTPLVGGTGAANNSKVTQTTLSNGRTGFFNLNPGQIYRDVDAGLNKVVNIYGNVWHDANALIDNEVNRTSVVAIPVGLNIYLVDNTTGLIIQSEGINPDGTYAFLGVETNKIYRIVLSSIVAGVGQQAPASTLPSGWRNTGENLGAGPNSGSDGVVNGLLFVDVFGVDVYDANFGIRVQNKEIIVG